MKLDRASADRTPAWSTGRHAWAKCCTLCDVLCMWCSRPPDGTRHAPSGGTERSARARPCPAVTHINELCDARGLRAAFLRASAGRSRWSRESLLSEWLTGSIVTERTGLAPARWPLFRAVLVCGAVAVGGLALFCSWDAAAGLLVIEL